ncbi:UPF0147 family protein [Candidatus Woesearchaeota archaeon]|nr:UPF0147 family protein [Candidatus Woesearchaeota archaeon]
MNPDVSEIIEVLQSLQEEIPRNLQQKVTNTIKLLQTSVEFSLTKNRVLNELEELSEENSLESYTRTQLLNVVSLLEEL